MVTVTDPRVSTPVYELRGVTKTYAIGGNQVHAVREVDLAVGAGESVAIAGPSGSGKTTLLQLLGALDRPSSGEVMFEGGDIGRMGDAALSKLRLRTFGFVFQQFNLLPTLTAEENITLPLAIGGRKPDNDWLDQVVKTLNLGDRLKHRPTQLSGGQQQRVACARALASKPEVIFADEPTGNLDSRSGADVLQFLKNSVRDFGQTIVMVTHDPNAASYADRVVFLADGKVVGEMLEPTADAVLDKMKHLDTLHGGV